MAASDVSDSKSAFPSDVRFNFGSDETQLETVELSSALLQGYSPVLERMLAQRSSDAQKLDMSPDDSADHWRAMKDFMDPRHEMFAVVNWANVDALVTLADKYDMRGVRSRCRDFLVNNGINYNEDRTYVDGYNDGCLVKCMNLLSKLQCDAELKRLQALCTSKWEAAVSCVLQTDPPGHRLNANHPGLLQLVQGLANDIQSPAEFTRWQPEVQAYFIPMMAAATAKAFSVLCASKCYWCERVKRKSA